jgi:hypothetical protein
MRNAYKSLQVWTLVSRKDAINPFHIIVRAILPRDQKISSEMSSSKPTTLLARHRLLAPNAGIFVSPICLGTMNFGGVYTSTLGECSKETAFEILDLFYSSGGNFLDTYASIYSPYMQY